MTMTTTTRLWIVPFPECLFVNQISFPDYRSVRRHKNISSNNSIFTEVSD